MSGFTIAIASAIQDIEININEIDWTHCNNTLEVHYRTI